MALPTLELVLVERPEVELEKALVRRFLAGDEQGFTLLVKSYRSRIFSFIYRIIGDREAAEDLTQETFLRVYRHIASFNQDKKFSTWIYTIASNLAKNELRDRQRRLWITMSSLDHRSEYNGKIHPFEAPDESSRPDKVFRRKELTQFIEESVLKLTPEHRQVFILREIEGKSYDEIAEITRVTLGTVKSRLNRARAAFATHIAPLLE